LQRKPILEFVSQSRRVFNLILTCLFLDFPDVIAHRGFSAENPENTMISYENAVKAGTTALEGGKYNR
jgi:glycerophosphoryl diester phosphodiesterase